MKIKKMSETWKSRKCQKKKKLKMGFGLRDRKRNKRFDVWPFRFMKLNSKKQKNHHLSSSTTEKQIWGSAIDKKKHIHGYSQSYVAKWCSCETQVNNHNPTKKKWITIVFFPREEGEFSSWSSWSACKFRGWKEGRGILVDKGCVRYWVFVFFFRVHRTSMEKGEWR